MSWYKSATERYDMDKMQKWYETRTNKHISLVRKYCKKIMLQYPEFDLTERMKIHDQSKFENPEKDPYVYITWKYKCLDDGLNFEDYDPPEDIDDQMNKATHHHVTTNSHHPEYHSPKKNDLLNRNDRDKPPDEIVDATKMPRIDIAEMCADWLSVSEEKGTSAKEWADKNVNIRWKFTNKQKDLIYELIDAIWK